MQSLWRGDNVRAGAEWSVYFVHLVLHFPTPAKILNLMAARVLHRTNNIT